jgi:sugar-specific transcriptional regulator TrmB
MNDNFADEIDDLIEKIINRIRDLKNEHEEKINKFLSELEKEKEESETVRITRRRKRKTPHYL